MGQGKGKGADGASVSSMIAAWVRNGASNETTILSSCPDCEYETTSIFLATRPLAKLPSSAASMSGSFIVRIRLLMRVVLSLGGGSVRSEDRLDPPRTRLARKREGCQNCVP